MVIDVADEVSATDISSSEDYTYPGICVVTHPLGAAGENATRTLLEILAAITSVSLVTADLPEESTIRERHEVIDITRKGARQSDVLVSAFRFVVNQIRMCRTIGQRDEEVILFFGATAYILPIVWSRLLGRTVVLEPRGDVPLTLRLAWERQLPEVLARFLAGTVQGFENLGYHLADGIVTYTPSMAEELGLNRYESKLYPRGARYVDTERFAPRTPFPERDRVVGFLGRIDEEKGTRRLAEVARRLPEDVVFRFIGDGDLLSWLRDELAEEIESGRVELAGWVDHDEVPAELNRFRLLVMSSAPTEGLPTTILEALACGTPVYATPVSGVPDVVREGETGFHMTATSPEMIAEDIERALNDDRLAEMSYASRERAVSEYSFEAAVGRYQQILRDL